MKNLDLERFAGVARSCCFSKGTTYLLHVTDACNEYCVHCMRSSGHVRVADVPVALLARALGGARRSFGEGKVVISGGEASLVPNLVELVLAIHELSFPVSLCTNAVAVGHDLAAALSRAGLAKATVSLDGPRAVHEAFRSAPRSFERALVGIRNLVQAGIVVTVNVTLHNEVIGAAASLAATLAELDIAGVTITSPMFQGRADQNRARFSDVTLENLERVWRDIRVRVSCPVELRVPRCNVRETCPSGKSVFAIGLDGQIRACPDVGAWNVVDAANATEMPVRLLQLRARA